MATVTRDGGRRVRRFLTAALLCVATLALLAVPASAQKSKGNFFVYQSTNCSGLAERSNDPKVSTPFSIGGRNYPANIDMELFATDLNSDPNETFGPFVVTTDAEGRFCQRVNQARPTHWKIDLVEPGSGFTDSKVIMVLPSAPVTTTTLPGQTTTTTTVPGQTTTTASTTTTSTTLPTTTTTTTTTVPTTTTTAAPTTTTTEPTTTTVATTTVPGQTTTTAAPGQSTTTVAGQTTTTLPGQTTTTTAATTTVAGQTTTTTVLGATTTEPEQDLGFEVEPVPVPPEGILPATGSTDTSELTAIAVALVAAGAAAYLTVRRRRPDQP